MASTKGESGGKRSGTSARGFASMDPQKQREIASKGGQAAHAQGTAHEFTPEEAAAAGRKGGQVVSRDRQHMSEIGRKGGERSGRRHQQRIEEQQPAVQTQQPMPPPGSGGEAPQSHAPQH